MLEFPNLGDGGIATTASTVLYEDRGVSFGLDALVRDTQGNFWVSCFLTNGVFKMNPAGLSGATPIPEQSGVSGPSIYGAASSTFDQSGNLWVLSENNSSLIRVDASKLAGGTNGPGETVFSTGAVQGFGAMQFSPPVNGLGLFP
jgi:hypothetical protein